MGFMDFVKCDFEHLQGKGIMYGSIMDEGRPQLLTCCFAQNPRDLAQVLSEAYGDGSIDELITKVIPFQDMRSDDQPKGYTNYAHYAICKVQECDDYESRDFRNVNGDVINLGRFSLPEEVDTVRMIQDYTTSLFQVYIVHYVMQQEARKVNPPETLTDSMLDTLLIPTYTTLPKGKLGKYVNRTYIRPWFGTQKSGNPAEETVSGLFSFFAGTPCTKVVEQLAMELRNPTPSVQRVKGFVNLMDAIHQENYHRAAEIARKFNLQPMSKQ